MLRSSLTQGEKVDDLNSKKLIDLVIFVGNE